MVASIFWYDFETTGIHPSSDRPMQVAGIRTDLDLNEIDTPINYYCKLAPDILPHPQACLVTGITPEILSQQGLIEADFFYRLHQELSKPQTCTAGYNNLRFDDEITRYGFYRNFYDPYGREWQSGNSRWDIIDLIRTCYALRPEGIVWPEQEGQVSLRLELLTRDNGIDHGQAHDALSDVRATIALAKLVKQRSPKLYNYLFDLRNKKEVQTQITLLKPIVHISGMFSVQKHYLSVVLPLAWHPTNRNAVIVCDLRRDIRPLLELSAEQIKTYLYTKHEDLPENVTPIPLKLIHINRCPVIAPLTVLRAQDIERLQLDLAHCFKQVDCLIQQKGLWQKKLVDIYQKDQQLNNMSNDPEQQLYSGFLSDRDRKLCEQLRGLPAEQLVSMMGHFEDERLSELLFRYRARNYPTTLIKEERIKWKKFCYNRLTDMSYGAPMTLQGFKQACQETQMPDEEEYHIVIKQWQSYIEEMLKVCFN